MSVYKVESFHVIIYLGERNLIFSFTDFVVKNLGRRRENKKKKKEKVGKLLLIKITYYLLELIILSLICPLSTVYFVFVSRSLVFTLKLVQDNIFFAFHKNF